MTKLTATSIALALLFSTTVYSAEIRTDTAAALRDFSAGRPLEGLPNLKKPVFVSPQSLICKSAGALANPVVQILLSIGSCVILDHRIRVSVFPPTGPKEYVEGYMQQMVEVSWRPEEMSNGNMYSGWVHIDALRN